MIIRPADSADADQIARAHIYLWDDIARLSYSVFRRSGFTSPKKTRLYRKNREHEPIPSERIML